MTKIKYANKTLTLNIKPSNVRIKIELMLTSFFNIICVLTF